MRIPVYILVIALFAMGRSFAQVIPDTSTRPAHIGSGIAPVPAGYYSNSKLNLIRTWTATRPFTDVADVVSTSRTVQEVKQSTQYFDGLGRPIQSVAKQASPSGRDMVSMDLYDAFGREAYKYLPYVPIDSNTNNGLFKRDPFNEQASFLNNSSYNPGLIGEQVYYGQTLFEASPLNRPVGSYAPGNSWGGSNVGTTMAYGANAAADSVRIWDIATTIGATPTSSGCYPANELYKTTVTDEHSKQVIEYKDKDGHTVLKKVQIATAPSTHHEGWLCTYYVYDDFGLLRSVIPPKAVEAIQGAGLWNISSTVRDELCFWYAYDGRKRPIVKKVPGSGQVHMVYDLRDRLVYVQDANLRTNFQWLKTVYDNLNRPTQTWLVQDLCSRYYMQEAVNSGEGSACGTEDPYTYMPDQLLTETYYDGYDWVSSSGSGLSSSFIGTYASNTNYFYSPSDNTWPYPRTIAADMSTRGMVTGSKVRILGTSTFLYSATFYDDRGRAVQTHSTNYSGGKDTVTMQYSFDGKLLRSLACQAKAGTNAQRYITLTKLEYDDMGRLTKTYKKINGSPEVLLVENSYDEMGQLKQKKLGQKRDATNWNTYTADVMDSLSYSYNIRGWLRGINKDYARNENGAVNWFGMELAYDHGFSTPQLNGNIAGTRWRSRGHDEQRAYGFGYDAANRLLKGDFTQATGGGWDNSAGVDYSMKMGNGSDGTSAYDANGNILKMWQRGLALGGSMTIDSMLYAYQTSSNKLARVTDGITADNKLGDFHDGTNTGDDYTYDANGNMYIDNNKKVTGITYNHLNLAQEVRVLGKGKIVYTYDASGRKLAKQVVDSIGSTVKTTTTVYLDGMVYRNDTLEYMAHEEGRLRLANDHTDTAYYNYFEKDHLGNIRAEITDELRKDVYHAGFEESDAGPEGQLFSRYTNIVGKPNCFDSNGENKKVQIIGAAAKLSDGHGAVVGAGKVIKVMAGDHVDASVNGWFSNGITNDTDPSSLTPLQDLLLALFSGGIVGTGGEHGGFTTGSGSLLSGGIADFLSTQDNYSSGGAYLNWVLLDDEQFRLVSSGSGFADFFKQAEGTGGGCTAATLLQANEGDGIDITRNGYLYIYLSNTNTDYPVFFDDLHIGHTRGPLVEETQYYPYGLMMAAISSKAATNTAVNRMKYNGKELQSQEFTDGSGLEWYDYGARDYDIQTGRWITIDPLGEKGRRWSPYTYAFDGPIRFLDPDGMWARDGKGNLVSEKGDNAQTLAKFLKIEDKGAVTLLKDNGFTANKKGVFNLGVGNTISSPLIAKKLELSDLAKVDIQISSKIIDINNTTIKELKEEVKTLAGSKVTEKQRLQNEQIISDATKGDPRTGNDGGRLVRYNMIQKQNERIDKRIESIGTQIIDLQRLNSSYQQEINRVQQYVLD